MSKISLNNDVNGNPGTNPKIFPWKQFFFHYSLSLKSKVLLYIDYLAYNIL